MELPKGPYQMETNLRFSISWLREKTDQPVGYCIDPEHYSLPVAFSASRTSNRNRLFHLKLTNNTRGGWRMKRGYVHIYYMHIAPFHSQPLNSKDYN